MAINTEKARSDRVTDGERKRPIGEQMSEEATDMREFFQRLRLHHLSSLSDV